MNPAISVIIPTFNRKEVLGKCLSRYERQTLPLDRFEIIVVDDGSTDGTWQMVEEAKSRLGFPLSCYRKENGGPGSARNLGIGNASGEVILIAGDDIFPHERLLSEHLLWHTEYYPEENAGVLGFVTWTPDPPPSPLMVWLERGYQNAFHLLEHGREVEWKYSYTGNLSLKRSFIGKTGEYFDERFPPYGYEDAEWGFRLSRKGFVLRYNRNAIGLHHHWIGLGDSLERMRKVGKSAYFLQRVHPQIYSVVSRGMFPASPIKERILAFALNGILVEKIYAPLAAYFAPRRIAGWIFTLCHVHSLRSGYFEARGIVGDPGKGENSG